MFYSNYLNDRADYPDRNAYGHCLTRNDINYKFITILKCASTWSNELLIKECYWKISNFSMTDLDDKINLVILRDPLERWIAAIKHLRRFPSENGVLVDLRDPEKLFSDVNFDPHLNLQVNSLQGLDLKNCIFFRFGPHLESHLLDFLNNMFNYNLQFKSEHSKMNNMNKKNYPVYTTISNFLKTEKYKNILYNYLEPDFELYNTVKFYEK